MKVEYTREEVFFRKAMGILCIMFLIGALLFALIPDPLLAAINWTGQWFGLKAPLVPTQISITKDVWNTLIDPRHTAPYRDDISGWPGSSMYEGLAVTMMLMIAFIAGMNFLNPRKYISWVPLLLVSKGASSVLGLLFFFFHAKYLSNLLLTITDFPIFIFILVIWLKARSSQHEVGVDEEDEEEGE